MAILMRNFQRGTNGLLNLEVISEAIIKRGSLATQDVGNDQIKTAHPASPRTSMNEYRSRKRQRNTISARVHILHRKLEKKWASSKNPALIYNCVFRVIE